MRASLLIAGNYVREQRWPLLVMVAVGVVLSVMAILFAGDHDPRDTSFLVKELLGYGLVIAPMMAAGAFYNDRRTRRILSVLSKGIERWEYLAGVMLGVAAVAVIYYAVLAFPMLELLRRSGLEPAQFFWISGLLFFASMLAAALALFYSTFMHPMLALAATSLTAAIPFLLRALAPAWGEVLPIVSLSQRAMLSPMESGWPLAQLALACVEIGMWFAAACVVFARRDIAAAVE